MTKETHPTMTEEQISRALEAAQGAGLLERLKQLYGGLRTGSCAGCARCCSESVNAFYIEFLAILERLNREPELKHRLLRRAVRHYMLEMVTLMPCPFLEEDKRCAIYEERPLVCRQFGHWSRRDFNRNAEAVARQNRQAAEYYLKNHGLVLPEEVVRQALPYCESFSVPHKTGPMKRGEQADDVFALDVVLLEQGLLDPELVGTPLVSWFVYTRFSPEEAGALRLQVMQEHLKTGQSPTLERILNSL